MVSQQNMIIVLELSGAERPGVLNPIRSFGESQGTPGIQASGQMYLG